jgi:hypothetical protein
LFFRALQRLAIIVFMSSVNPRKRADGDDFTHWRLETSGKNAAYAFYEELANGRVLAGHFPVAKA